MSSSEIDEKSAIDLFEEAFERLKKGEPTNLPPGSRVSLTNVAKEAERSPSALRSDRYPILIQRIKAYMATEKEEQKSTTRASNRSRNRRIEERLADCTRERDRLQSICYSQQTMIEELREEIYQLENGNKVINLSDRKDG